MSEWSPLSHRPALPVTVCWLYDKGFFFFSFLSSCSPCNLETAPLWICTCNWSHSSCCNCIDFLPPSPFLSLSPLGVSWLLKTVWTQICPPGEIPADICGHCLRCIFHTLFPTESPPSGRCRINIEAIMSLNQTRKLTVGCYSNMLKVINLWEWEETQSNKTKFRESMFLCFPASFCNTLTMKSFLFIFLFYFFLGKVQVKSSDIQVGDLIIVEKVLNYIVTMVNNVY